MLYSFFWTIPRRLNFMRRRFGTLCSVFLSRVSKNLVHTTYEGIHDSDAGESLNRKNTAMADLIRGLILVL
jgi:hypothetical protein